MIHIMSLIRESLGTSESPAKAQPATRGANALKVDHEETFHEILSHMPSSPSPATSAARIKAHHDTSAKKPAHQAHQANRANRAHHDVPDDDETTTCMTPDDFLAWAFNAQSAAQAISARGLGQGNVDPTAKTVPMMEAVRANALGASALGDSMMPAGGFGLYAQPSSGPIGTMASILEPPSAQLANASDDADGPTTERVSITQLARSKNATEVPPPSVLPNVEADLPIETARQTPVAKTLRPVADTTAAAIPQARNSIGASNDQPFDLKTRWNRIATQQAHASTMMSMHAVRGPAPQPRPQTKTTSADTQVDMAAVHPESDSSFRAAEVYAPLASLAQPSLQPGTLSVRVPRADYAATEARQQAVMFAVNQMTLRRVVADGELDIPELGKVRVDAQTKNGEVEVKITAEREDTRTLVNAHAQAIALDARTAAIPIANVHVEGADKNAGAQTSFSGSNSGPKDEQRHHDIENKTREITPDAKRGATKARFVL